MKKIYLIVLISLNYAFCSSHEMTKMYASLYADELLAEFDRKLDLKLTLNDHTPIFKMEEYQQLLTARMMIESTSDHTHSTKKSNTFYYPSFSSANYKVVKKQIQESSKLINNHLNKLFESQDENLVIYPSTNSDGNLTGNTYPKNVWSLTFDDGPHRSRTNRVLDNLNEAGLKATFFVLVEKSNIYKSITNTIINDGMELALHSYTHPNLSKSSSNLEYEITKAKKDLEERTNSNIKVFRLPYGAGMRSGRVREVIAKNKMVHVFWNIDTLDWQDKNPSSIFERTKKMMELTPNKSGIILFHDIHNQSVIASKMVMDYLTKMNKTVCTVSEVIDHMNNKKQECIK